MSRASFSRAHVRPRHAVRQRRHLVAPALASVVLAGVGFYGMFGVANAAMIQANANTQDVSAISGGTSQGSEYISAPVAGDDPGQAVDANEGEDLNILVVGSDVRSGENANLGGYVDGARGDTTIIVHISADRQRVELVSIPRDARVAISTCESLDGQTQRGWDAKFNVAFANGYDFNNSPAEAAACVMRTITDISGIEFNGQYIVADFAGFREMVDALGGVPMCIPTDMRSPKADLDLKAGPQVLDGTQALALARARYGLGDGTDIMRIDRQQELIEAILEKALGVNAFTDVDVLTDFVRAATDSFTMSNEFASVTYDFGLLYSLRNINLDNVVMATTPWRYASDGTSDVLLNPEVEDIWEAVRNDTPLADVLAVQDAPLAGDDNESSPEPSAPTDVDLADNESTMYLPVPPAASYEISRQTQDEILDACAPLEDS